MTVVRAGGADITTGGGVPGAGLTRIDVDRADGRCRCMLQAGHLTARVIDQDADGARVALVATEALLLGGDHVRIAVRVGPGAWLDVVETAGTVAYDASGVRSSWHLTAQVGAGGVLTWPGLPFVVADGADVDRCTDVVLAAGARACMREMLVLGRTGEHGGDLRSSTRITLDGVPLLVEDLDLTAAGRVPGIVGEHRVLDSVVVAGYRPAPDAGENAAVDTVQLDLEGPGALVRYLGDHAHTSPLRSTGATWAAQSRP